MSKPSVLPILDWKSRHDPKSREFPIRSLIGEHVPKRRRMWRGGTVLNQGREGACVGFGWTGELLASPRRSPVKVPASVGNSFALRVYNRAKLLDPWPGVDYSGTSVLAGAQAIRETQMIDSYRWCFGIDDVRDALIAEGPVVIGIPWFESMYETDADGNVTVDGEMVGGHCILLTGYDPAREVDGAEVFRWRNSWGRGYGKRGNGFIKAADLSTLLEDQGEACVPIGRREVQIAA